MWALCRASNLQKLRGFVGYALNLGCPHPSFKDPQLVAKRSSRPSFDTLRASTSSANTLLRGFSSQVSSKPGDCDDDNEDLFAELDIPLNTQDMEDEDCCPEAAYPDKEEPTLSKLVDEEQRKSHAPEVYLLMKSSSVQNAISKWVVDGRKLDRQDVVTSFKLLIVRGKIMKAWHLSKFLATYDGYEFTQGDYIRHLNLIAKVEGIAKAEQYVKQVPPQFQTEPLYRTLLARCVSVFDLQKSQEVFNKMKDLKFSLSIFSLNQLLLLYYKLDKKKIADVLLLMEKSKLQPNLFTFGILIGAKGSTKDIAGMEQIIETMKTLGIEPNSFTLTEIATHYTSAGLYEKAESILKDVEGESIKDKDKRAALPRLISLYAKLGKSDDVSRVWRICESNPFPKEYIAGIAAYGNLKNIDQAEKIFETMSLKWKNLSADQYDALLLAYAENGCYEKGKMLFETIEKKGVRWTALTTDSIVRLLVEAGEVDAANSILVRNRVRPMFRTFLCVMGAYAAKGDVHNAESIFNMMREWGYVSRAKQFSVLLLAYVKAKMPAYGMKDRMKADNVFPDKEMATQIADIDSFAKSTHQTTP